MSYRTGQLPVNQGTTEHARHFWERVFFERVEFYRSRGWDDSASTCAAKDADSALREWRERWDKHPPDLG